MSIRQAGMMQRMDAVLIRPGRRCPARSMPMRQDGSAQATQVREPAMSRAITLSTQAIPSISKQESYTLRPVKSLSATRVLADGVLSRLPLRLQETAVTMTRAHPLSQFAFG